MSPRSFPTGITPVLCPALSLPSCRTLLNFTQFPAHLSILFLFLFQEEAVATSRLLLPSHGAPRPVPCPLGPAAIPPGLRVLAGWPWPGEGSPGCALLQKITTKNAFGLHLIDYMTEILKQKNSELTNFKVRGVAAAAALFPPGN